MAPRYDHTSACWYCWGVRGGHEPRARKRAPVHLWSPGWHLPVLNAALRCPVGGLESAAFPAAVLWDGPAGELVVRVSRVPPGAKDSCLLPSGRPVIRAAGGKDWNQLSDWLRVVLGVALPVWAVGPSSVRARALPPAFPRLRRASQPAASAHPHGPTASRIGCHRGEGPPGSRAVVEGRRRLLCQNGVGSTQGTQAAPLSPRGSTWEA